MLAGLLPPEILNLPRFSLGFAERKRTRPALPAQHAERNAAEGIRRCPVFRGSDPPSMRVADCGKGLVEACWGSDRSSVVVALRNRPALRESEVEAPKGN